MFFLSLFCGGVACIFFIVLIAYCQEFALQVAAAFLHIVFCNNTLKYNFVKLPSSTNNVTTAWIRKCYLEAHWFFIWSRSFENTSPHLWLAVDFYAKVCIRYSCSPVTALHYIYTYIKIYHRKWSVIGYLNM